MINPFITFKNFIKRKLAEFLYPAIDKITMDGVKELLKELSSNEE